MAYIPVCDKHLGKGKIDAAACVPYGDPDPDNIDAVRDVTAALEDMSGDEGKLARAGYEWQEDNSPPWGQAWKKSTPQGEHYIVHSGPREKGRYQHVFYPSNGDDRDEVRSSHGRVEDAIARGESFISRTKDFDLKTSPYWSGRGESRPWNKPVPKKSWPIGDVGIQRLNGWRRLSG